MHVPRPIFEVCLVVPRSYVIDLVRSKDTV